MRAYFLENPPLLTERFLINVNLYPRLAAALSTAHTRGIVAGRLEREFTIPQIEDNNGTAEIVLNQITTSGYIYGT